MWECTENPADFDLEFVKLILRKDITKLRPGGSTMSQRTSVIVIRHRRTPQNPVEVKRRNALP